MLQRLWRNRDRRIQLLRHVQILVDAMKLTTTITVERESTAWDSDVIDAVCEYTVELTCNAIPYRAATLLDPPEGGLEDIEATLDGEEFELTASEEEEARELLLEKWHERNTQRQIERFELEESN
jgi:hypothetical protein